MRFLLKFVGIGVLLFVVTPNKIESQKPAQPAATIEGTISKFECGDNCYLTIVDKKGTEHTGLCLASICKNWTINQKMPSSYLGKSVRATVGTGNQVDSEGTVMGTTDAFTRILLL